MITLKQYVGPHSGSRDWTVLRQEAAVELLRRVNALLLEAEVDGVAGAENSQTQSQVSGVTFGGFRPQNCPQGAPNSSHKEGRAVDIFDPKDRLDDWITAHPGALVRHNLYREAACATAGWLHLTTRAPASKSRSFLP